MVIYVLDGQGFDFLLQNVQASSGAHPAPYLQWLRRSGRKADHSASSGAEVANEYHLNELSLSLFSLVCLQDVQSDNFTLPVNKKVKQSLFRP